MYVVDSTQLLKPVNDILRAQAAKEKAAKERQFSTEMKPVAKEILVGKDEKGMKKDQNGPLFLFLYTVQLSQHIHKYIIRCT